MEIGGDRAQLLVKLMSATALRDRWISSNIANQSVPGYKRRDVRFEELLQERIARGEPDLLAVEPKVEVDTTANGKPDEARFYIGGKLSRVQLDANDDGKPDVWEIYDEGKLQRRGVDLDHDGRVDRWDRDEIALRELADRERKEEIEARKKEEAAQKKASADAGAPDAAAKPRP